MIWIPFDVADPVGAGGTRAGAAEVVKAGGSVISAARAGAVREAIEALGAFRVLCAHRRGPHGVVAWTARIEAWLEAELDDFAADEVWYVGRPLLVNENDYELRLYNGDTGVIVQSAAERAGAVFERGGEILQFSPTRLERGRHRRTR